MASDQNTLDAIPALKPDHEDIALRQQGSGGRGKSNKPAKKPRKESSGGWLLVLLCLMAVAALAAWTYLLNQQLQSSRRQLADASGRLLVLEQKLSVTDESMSQSSVALQVKLKDMDTEIRKLWDNVWKRAKQDLAQHGKDIETMQAELKKLSEKDGQLSEGLSQSTLALTVMEDQLEASSQVAAELSVLKEQVVAQEKSLEEMRDLVSGINKSTTGLKKRVADNEEWVDSFNGYRTQMNRKLLDLQGSVNALQTP